MKEQAAIPPVPAGKALVTGATSGIGLAISQRLLAEGWQVYGVGRDMAKLPDEVKENRAFHRLETDFSDRQGWMKMMRKTIREVDFDLLVNNAGTAYYGIHEEVSAEQVAEMVRVNLEVPMILTNWVLPGFKKRKRTIVFIASETAKNPANPHGAAYGATKAGLLSFAGSIFAEGRKTGLRVTTIVPDMTRTELYRNADFGVDEDPQTYLTPEEVADAVLYAVSRPAGVVIPEIVISPQKHRIKKKGGR